MTKREIRERYIEKRKLLSEDELKQKSEAIAHRFFNSVDMSKLNLVHIFIPMKKFNEVNTWVIINKIWKNFPHVKLATSITTNDRLKHVLIDKNTEFINNKWGIPTPQNGREVTANEIDLVITPLLAFDQHLHRVGYGKGYYDKFFADCRSNIQKIGVSLFPQLEMEIEDINEFDQKLDHVISA